MNLAEFLSPLRGLSTLMWFMPMSDDMGYILSPLRGLRLETLIVEILVPIVDGAVQPFAFELVAAHDLACGDSHAVH